ncbi:antirestriction protein [Vibrio astriarenae]|nr:antirestriction protein [Vibrio sp. C7]
MAVDAHQEVTNRIIKALETGVKPWVKPWGLARHFFQSILSLAHNIQVSMFCCYGLHKPSKTLPLTTG